MRLTKNNQYKKLASNTLLFALGNFGSKFLIFFLLPLYTNILSTYEYGVSELVITGSNLLMPFAIISIQDATMRFCLDTKCDNGEVAKNSIIVLIIGSIITIMLYPLISLYKPYTGYVHYFILISITNMIRTVFSMYIKAIGKTTIFAIDSITYTAILLVLNIIFLTVLYMSLDGYFLAMIIANMLSIIFLSITSNIFSASIKAKTNLLLMKEMIRFSAPMVLNNVSWWILNSSDKMMLEYFESAAESGLYSVASKMPSILITITNIFNQAWTISSVTEYDSNKDENFYSNTFLVYNCFLIVISSIIIIIIKPFMKIYVGENFVTSWKYVPVLLLGSIFLSYAAFFGAIYTSAKKNMSIMLTTSLAAIINIFLNSILIPYIGIQGAVIATAVSYLVVFIFRMIDSKKYIDFRIDYIKLALSHTVLVLQCISAILDFYIVPISLFSFISLLVINKDPISKIMNKFNVHIL